MSNPPARGLVLVAPPEGVIDRAEALRPAENPAIVYVETHCHTAVSRKTGYATLRRIARALDLPGGWQTIPWSKFGAREAGLLVRRAEDCGYAARTVALMIAVWRGVMQTAFDLGQLDVDGLARATRFPKLGIRSEPAGRALTPEETSRLRVFCRSKPPPYGVFLEAMLFGVMLGGGLRRAEVSFLPLGARQREVLEVFGKGQKTRRVPLPRFSVDLLEAWEGFRKNLPCSLDRLFVQIDELGRVKDAGYTPDGVWWVTTKVFDAVGLGDVTPHDLRRTYASRLLERGVDLSLLQHLMGHASVTTTIGYDRRDESRAAEAVHVLDDGF